MDSRGFSLIELLVAITIIAIVMVVTGVQFFGWQAKYKVESEIKELEATLMDARMRARQKNRAYFILCDKSTDEARRSFVVYEDDGDEIFELNGDDTEVGDLTKRGLPYRLDWDENKGPTPLGNKFAFAMDTRGFVGMSKVPGDPSTPLFFPLPWPRVEGTPENMELWLIDPDGQRYIPADIPDSDDRPDVSYDCIRVMETRVNIGKLNDGGDSCDEK